MVVLEHPTTGVADVVHHGRRHLAVATAFVATVVLLVTAAVLAVALPDTANAGHWSLAWSGLDVATAACALGTGVLLLRDDRRAALTSGAAATLLVLDAWFDVTTASTATGLWVAVGEAVLLELPLAVLAARFAIAWLRTGTPAAPGVVAARPVPRSCPDAARPGPGYVARPELWPAAEVSASSMPSS